MQRDLAHVVLDELLRLRARRVDLAAHVEQLERVGELLAGDLGERAVRRLAMPRQVRREDLRTHRAQVARVQAFEGDRSVKDLAGARIDVALPEAAERGPRIVIQRIAARPWSSVSNAASSG